MNFVFFDTSCMRRQIYFAHNTGISWRTFLFFNFFSAETKSFHVTKSFCQHCNLIKILAQILLERLTISSFSNKRWRLIFLNSVPFWEGYFLDYCILVLSRLRTDERCCHVTFDIDSTSELKISYCSWLITKKTTKADDIFDKYPSLWGYGWSGS